ncbi:MULTISPECIES: glycosyltransferase family 1 protein [unclassified Microbacterium]|uniref:glycosyltransferase family 1 protein n=1 Tax=unclassified Microbacterium TaxID=2609290 RepID=UPI000EA84E22|nr:MULTISPECIES: glycosyltransferase family 1 protein [unclassified Microbacterium]MBT2485398.1 glycosyltransferase family 1 protein [Microbacterium sp. ISL-108]RKN68201.1 glycosyltransferase family 1 protein [Microbacterium sp. CGR2]
MTKLLIISFSNLASDARLQRQISAFTDTYEVITAGWGAAPAGVSKHIVLPQPLSGASRKRRLQVESILLRLRAYRLLHATSPSHRAARRALRGVDTDIVLANDIDAAPLAYDIVAPDKVHVDLHEFFPGLHDDNPKWAAYRGPFNGWLVRRFAKPAASTTTVAAEIAERYRAFGLDPQVVTNASHLQDRDVQPVGSPIRLVHTGAALAGRHLETMIEGVALSRADVALTLHLMPNDRAYIEQLRARAAQLPNVQVLDAVPHDALIETLAQHDVGIHILPATSTNHRLALPNKFFDFVQARLGVIVGPTAAMAGMTERHGFGAVTEGFAARDVADVLDDLTPETVAAWKTAAHAAAGEMSAEHQVGTWVEAVDRLRAHQVEDTIL